MLEANWKDREWRNEMALTQAWLTARLSLSNPRKFPKLHEITGKRHGPTRQSPEQMLANVRALKAMFEGDNDDG